MDEILAEAWEVYREHPVIVGHYSDRKGNVYNEEGCRLRLNYHSKNKYYYINAKFKGKRYHAVWYKFVWECFNGAILPHQRVRKTASESSGNLIDLLYLDDNRGLIYGCGINDSKVSIKNPANAEHYAYSDWCGLLERVVLSKTDPKYVAYKNVTVAEDWLYFSNFLNWAISQPNKNWRKCHLDKDLFSLEHPKYSSETCAYLDRKINNFISSKQGENNGKYLVGACFIKSRNDWLAQCVDPFKPKSKHVGYFKTELEAHLAWKFKKHEYACRLAELQDDPRVADALRQRYTPDKDWTKQHYNEHYEQQLTLLGESEQ
jgi:hypothetical protein